MRRYLAAALMLPALAVMLHAHAAPDPAAIMRKAAEAVKKAKTYQATWHIVTSMGDMGSLTMEMVMKTTADGKAHVTTKPIGTPTGMMAMGAAMAETTMVSDGKTLWVYLKGMNAYQKAPMPKDANPALGNVLSGVDRPGSKYRYLGTQVIRGKQCHVIGVDAPRPAQAPQDMKMETRAFVEVATGRLRQVKSVITMAGMTPPGPNGQGSSQGNKPAKPMTITTTVVLISETLNAPLSPALFKFTPPPGAREMRGGMIPGMGPMGAPGAPVPGARPSAGGPDKGR